MSASNAGGFWAGGRVNEVSTRGNKGSGITKALERSLSGKKAQSYQGESNVSMSNENQNIENHINDRLS